MGIDQKENNEGLLLDIRSSYRLLHEFSHSIRGLTKKVEFFFSLTENGADPLFSSTTTKSNLVKMNKWTWDWFNLYFYQSRFRTKAGHGLSVTIQADTGYWDSDSSRKTDVDSYASVEASRSFLIVTYHHSKLSGTESLLDEDWMQSSHLTDWVRPNPGFMISRKIDLSTIDMERDFIPALEQFEIDSVGLGFPKIRKLGES